MGSAYIFEEMEYFFKNKVCINLNYPIILNNDDHKTKLYRTWYPCLSMCSLGTHTFAIVD